MTDSEQTYRLLIAYDGTTYCGWQIQPNGISIQEKIQQALTTVIREEVVVIGSGRTDAGVHALGQVAHFRCRQILDARRLAYSLNALLPKDIRVMDMTLADPSFHAQYSVKRKIYHYHLWLDLVQSPFQRLYSFHVHHRVDLTRLQSASQLFLGTHDFTAFANSAHEGTAAHDPVRTLFRVDVVQEEGGVRLEFEGDGFLYKMVRTMVGTLLEVSRGKRPLEDIPVIFSSQDRRKAGTAVPPHGLFLVQVIY